MNLEPNVMNQRKENGHGAATQDCEVWSVASDDPHFPARLANSRLFGVETTLYGLGDRDLLTRKYLGLICSVQCPGSVVIKTFDAIRELRDAGVVIVGGFHSPMEQECLDFLLRGNQPVIISPARGLGRPRLPAAQREAVRAGRLMLLSIYGKSIRRTTKARAQARNAFVAALASAVLIPHASPGGNATTVAQQVLQRGQSLFTINDEVNIGLINSGAHPYNVDEIHGLTACDSEEC